MSHAASYTRSPELMSRSDSALVVIDVQEKLMPLIQGQARIEWNIGRLLDGAKLLGVPVVASEQYPKGLGHTVAPLREKLASVPEKMAFSCGVLADTFRELAERGVYKLLLCGIEAHVCVQQSALDLLAAGFRIFVAVDAVGARYEVDYQTALRRLEGSGATLTTTESSLFEWCETSAAKEFKEISALIRRPAPSN